MNNLTWTHYLLPSFFLIIELIILARIRIAFYFLFRNHYIYISLIYLGVSIVFFYCYHLNVIEILFLIPKITVLTISTLGVTFSVLNELVSSVKEAIEIAFWLRKNPFYKR
ncbi:hypothetical protein DTQ70_30030 (plasmid) [Runella sp. SP2]|nr:hypothetical protein DTQ70_30030 [Runella sp. SP2]